MAHARRQHPNAVLTPTGRARMVGLCHRAGAGRLKQPLSGSRSTPRRSASGVTGSSPKASTAWRIGRVGRKRSPNQTGPTVQRRVRGAAHPASVGCCPHRPRARPGPVDRASDPAPCRTRPARVLRPCHRRRAAPPLSTRGSARRARACGREEDLRHPDRRRVAHPRPRSSADGEALHVSATGSSTPPIDDRTRLAYSEILTDEQAETTTAFWTPAHPGSPPRHHRRTGADRQRLLLPIALSPPPRRHRT